MGPKPLWKRAAALLAAVGMSIFLAGGISADDENAEAEAARVLKPTQAIAEVPEEYNELFEIQWGGGSLYYLKARLATMGCMLNTIWAYDNNRWFSYNQYNVPHSLNQAFITQFKDSIPAATLYATCIEICSFDIDTESFLKAGECKSWEQDIQPVWIQQKAELQANGHPVIDDDAVCNNDFHPLVKEKVFSLLPLMPDTCIVRQLYTSAEYTGTRFIRGGAYAGYIVLWLEPPSLYNDENLRERISVRALHTEIHELCHIQQGYYLVQQAPLNQTLHIEIEIYKTDANKEFMDTVGFTEPTEWNFELPEDSVYREIYSKNPIELSAELCSLYLLDMIGEESKYALITYHSDYEGPKVPNPFDPYRYLTPEIIEWLETYMVLPYPNAEEAEEEAE